MEDINKNVTRKLHDCNCNIFCQFRDLATLKPIAMIAAGLDHLQGDSATVADACDGCEVPYGIS